MLGGQAKEDECREPIWGGAAGPNLERNMGTKEPKGGGWGPDETNDIAP